MKAGKDLHTLLMKFTNKYFLKFLLVGGLNTLITYLVYLFFIMYIRYSLAYGIAYIFGIVSSYLMNSLIVFKESLNIRKMMKFPLVYLFQFLASIVILNIFIEFIKINAKLAPLIVIVITTPFTFILSKNILTNKISKNK